MSAALLGISIALSLVGSGVKAVGHWMQGRAERKQLEKEKGREMERQYYLESQYAEKEKDIRQESEFATSSLLTGAAAAGIEGPMAAATRGFTLEEYNRAISMLGDELGMAQKSSAWTLEDIETGIEQSKINQYYNIGATLLTGASDAIGLGYQASVMRKARADVGPPISSMERRDPHTLSLYKQGKISNTDMKKYNVKKYGGLGR